MSARDDDHAAGTHLDGLLGESLLGNPPLGLHDRLDDVPTLGADGDLHRVLGVADVQTLLLHLLDDLLPRVETLHAFEFGSGVGVEGSVVVQNVDELELVAHTDLVIVRVVGRGHLDRSRTEFLVDRDRVRDDRDPAAEEGVNGKLAVEVRVPLVVRVDGNRGISQKGLGSGRRDDNLLIRTLERVSKRSDDSELDLVLDVVTRNRKKSSSGDVLLVDLRE